MNTKRSQLVTKGYLPIFMYLVATSLMGAQSKLDPDQPCIFDQTSYIEGHLCEKTSDLDCFSPEIFVEVDSTHVCKATSGVRI